ncbi:MAG: hypothetical protein HRU75_10125 [Planctomycetia bacterium]|nr:MAG: hypothetical protein HRU75_10125 [Planctomycetia bacterium]
MFVGSHELTIDAKNRVSIPFSVRSKMNTDADGRGFYVVPGRRPGTLAIHPEKPFEAARKALPAADSLSAEAYEWRQWESAVAAFVDPDAQGRILIPDRLLRKAGIRGEVTLAGVGSHLELWNRADYTAFEDGKWPSYAQEREKAISEMNRLSADPARRT